MSGQRHTYRDPKETADTAHNTSLLCLKTRLPAERMRLLLFPGHDSAAVVRSLCAHEVRLVRIHLFWVDERAVPPNHEQSNFRLAEQSFLLPARFPMRMSIASRRNYGRILAPSDTSPICAPSSVSDGRYSAFNVIHQGMGPDAAYCQLVSRRAAD